MLMYIGISATIRYSGDLKVAETESGQMSQSPIELKGSSFTLSVVHLYDLQPEVIRQALIEKVQQAPAFLKNAPVVVNMSNLSAGADWPQLQQAITDAGLHVIGVSGCNDVKQKRDVSRAGLPLLNEGKGAKRGASTQSLPPISSKPRIINTPVRSGQQIYARGCDLIVVSNVSAGAELIADGNIHIYGTMRGRALAGACGDVTSQVFCINLEAELVSIAGQYWLSDQIPESFFGQPARLSLRDNTLTIQSLY